MLIIISFKVCSRSSIEGIVELTINRSIYKCVPWYHVQLLSQCIKQSINQFSFTQRSITTFGYKELRWNSVSKNLSPLCILEISDVVWEAKCSLPLLLLFACIQLSVLKVSEVKKNLIFIDLRKVNFNLLTELKEKSY